jgi:argonaute-like protein
MELYGEILQEPLLRFDHSSESAVDTGSRRGLSRYGPYDSNLFPKAKVNAIVIFPEAKVTEKNTLVSGLTVGEGRFQGFESYFKIPIDFVEEIPIGLSDSIDILVNNVALKNPDIVFVVLENQHTRLYSEIKSILLSNGVPSQMATVEKLSNAYGRQYTLENIALASYAKVGGSPWTVSTQNIENDLILGVSRAQEASGKYLVGYVSLFTKDGDFLFMNSGAPVYQWNQYVEGLSQLINTALREFQERFEPVKGKPSSVVVHFCKKASFREVEAIENGINESGFDIPFSVLHLNEYSNFRLFDTSQSSYLPPKGLKVSLSEHEALLMLDGAVNGNRRRIGMPRVLDIRMDKRSSLESDKFPTLLKQMYDFASINWRGFNAAAIPITLNYSKLISKMVCDLGIDTWNATISQGILRDKAWFL